MHTCGSRNYAQTTDLLVRTKFYILVICKKITKISLCFKVEENVLQHHCSILMNVMTMLQEKNNGKPVERAVLYEKVYSHKDGTTIITKAVANIVSIIQKIHGEIL